MLLLAALLVATPADDDRRALAEHLYTTGAQEERDLDLAHALEHYEASIATDPSTRYALRARTRADWLKRHSEGDFQPLVQIEHLRRDPKAQFDAVAIDAFASKLEQFPPGEVRCESRMLVAEAYGSRLGRKDDARRELDALLSEPKCDPPLRAQAATQLTDLSIDRGDLAGAERAAQRGTKVAPTLLAHVHQLVRRRWLHRIAIVILAALALVGAWGVVRTLRAKKSAALGTFATRAALVCVYLTTAGALLAGSYEAGHALPFIVLGVAMFAIAILSRASALGGRVARPIRIARASLAAASVFAAALLILERIDAGYLDGFGL